MAGYLVLFQIGPVQEFIRAARKTQDFWAGSFLLSFLTARAILVFGEDKIIFPHILQSPLYLTVKKAHPLIWPEAIDAPAAYIPSLPNRFFAVTPENPQDQLEKTKTAVLKAWEEIAGQVWEKIREHLAGPASPRPTGNNLPARLYHWNSGGEDPVPGLWEQWEEQVRNRALEILYVWQEMAGEDYAAAYRATEALMGARKSSRFFMPLTALEGYACSLCGLRVSLTPGKCHSRRDLRAWWNGAMRKHGLTHRFREGEHLCAVCAIKRLYPEVVLHKDAEIPSTSTMATVTFQRDLQYLMRAPGLEESDLRELQGNLQDFRGKAVQAAGAIGEPKTASLPRYFENNKFQSEGLLRVDGDWLIGSIYQHPKHREKAQDAFAAWKALGKKISALMEKVNRARLPSDTPLHRPAPAKYLALMAADADFLGKLLSGCSREQHQVVSRLLGEFATRHVPRLLEEEAPGFIFYWGGDEGLAMLSLADLLPAMQQLRDTWRAEVEQQAGRAGIAPPPTLSLGAVIVHHQYPLRAAIREVYQVLEFAKELRSRHREKDAWAVKILKRSGAPLVARAHWDYRRKDEADFNPLVLLQNFILAYQEELLSPRWLAALEAEEKALGDPPEAWPRNRKEQWWRSQNQSKVVACEIQRLLLRHGQKGEVEGLVDGTLKLNEEISGIPPDWNFSRHNELKSILHLANYIAKGGGR